jgi:hypothetical protein
MKKTIEENGEKIIDTWTLHCIPFESSKFLGKLHVTQDNLYFDAQFDSSVKGLINSVATSVVVGSGHALIVSSKIVEDWESKGYMFIDKKSIKNITEKSSFLKKTIILTLEDDSVVIFDYGMMGVKKIIKAIKQ